MKIIKVTDHAALRSWLLSVVTASSAMSRCHAEQLEFLVYGLDLHDYISEQYFFLISAMKMRVCKNPGAVHESMLSDVHIGENVPLA